VEPATPLPDAPAVPDVPAVLTEPPEPVVPAVPFVPADPDVPAVPFVPADPGVLVPPVPGLPPPGDEPQLAISSGNSSAPMAEIPEEKPSEGRRRGIPDMVVNARKTGY
jgi:hypothetical protein